MNVIAVVIHCFILLNIALGDEDTSSLALLVRGIGGGGGGSGGGGNGGSGGGSAGGGGGNIFEQIFGTEANAFGGSGGNPFSMSFLTAAMADMGENIGIICFESLSQQVNQRV
jgi:DnaJ-class molecular chaperone